MEMKGLKKRAVMDGADNGSSNGNCVAADYERKKMELGIVPPGLLPHLPIEIVFEIFTRLSIKDLFKCKYLSKAWLLNILCHPQFADAYCRHNPRFVVVSYFYANNPLSRSFYYSGVRDGDEFVLTSTVSITPRYKFNTLGSTKVIDGLVCLYDRYGVLYLHHTLTGEIMKLPPPPSPLFADKESVWDRYSFGFDPIRGEYKLLRMIFSRHTDTAAQTYILTLGSNFSWRMLPYGDFEEREYLKNEGFLVNGILYWRTFSRVLSFNLNKEEFDFIEKPAGTDPSYCFLAQFKGHLSLVPIYYGHPDVKLGAADRLIIYVLNIDSSKRDYLWTKVNAKLPIELQPTGGSLVRRWQRRKRRAIPVGSLPTGELLLADAHSGHTFTTIYSYINDYNDSDEEQVEKNSKKKKQHQQHRFKKFLTIGKLPKSTNFQLLFPNDPTFFISFVKPNFAKLHSLIHSQKGRDIK